MSEALTLLDARDDATALPLPLRPRLVSASRITLSFGEAMGLAGADMGLTLIRQSSRYADPAALTVLPHQTHLDADVSISVDVGGALMTTRARIANVTGAERFDLVGYPLPPRQVFLTVDVLHE